MSGRMTKAAFAELIAGNIEWLRRQPPSLERDHIQVCLNAAVEAHYPEDYPDRAEARGHAAGYAEAVGDVVAWLDSCPLNKHMREFSAYIKSGEHVGAAKKGAE